MVKKFVPVLFIIILLSSVLTLIPFEGVVAEEPEINDAFGFDTHFTFTDLTIIEESNYLSVSGIDNGYTIRFYDGGYNEIWKGGVQVVADSRWVLEYLQGQQWKSRGIFQETFYIIETPYKTVVTRTYTDYLDTNWNMTYVLYGGTMPKIIFNGTLTNDEYRIRWALSGINKNSYELTDNKIMFDDEFYIDYTDVFNTVGDVTNVDVDQWAGNRKLNIIFSIGTVSGHYELDPSFGETTILANASPAGADDITAVKYNLPEAGCVYSMSIYINNVGGGNNLLMGLYDDNGGGTTPDNLLAETATSATALGWLTLTFISNVSLASGDYWLAWQNDANIVNQYRWAAGAANQRADDNTATYPNLDDPYVKSGNAAQKWSIFANYTVGVCAGTITASFYAADGSTTADTLTPVYITMTNTTNTFVFSLTGLTEVMGGQNPGSMNFSAQAYNTSNSNSFIKINGTNIFEYTASGDDAIRFWLAIYQSVEWTYQKANGTTFTATYLEITFGNNGTKANITSNSIFVNGSNTIHQIDWFSDNVKNSTTIFNVTSHNQDLVFMGRIYTLRLTAVDAIGMTDLPGTAVHYNMTLANSTTVSKVATVGGIAGIYLQNDTSPATVTAWWHGVLVNSSITYVISGNNVSDVILQVGRDLSGKTLFAEGTDEKGVFSMMIEGLEVSYQVEPTSIIMNATTYTNGTWIGTWNYTSALNLLNLSDTTLKSQTIIHTITIDILERQVQFNATGSETFWLVAYGGVACAGTIRTINLVNEISASPFDVGGEYNVNVTAFYSNFFLSVSQNDQSFTVCDEPLLLASVNSTSTGTTYFRSLIPSDLVQNMYIPDITQDSIALYTLNFIDLTDSFEGATIRIFISSVEIASGFVDSAFRFQVYLIDGELFTVTLTSATGSFTPKALNANPASTSMTITIGSIDILPDRDVRSNIIVWAAVWVGANIQVQYEDSENATTALEITIYEQNFENKTYIVLFNQAFGVNSSVTVIQAANATRGHYVKMEFTQPSFGSVQEQRVPVRANFGFPMPDLPASILGMDVIFPGVTNAWVFFLSLMIIVGTAFVFGALFSANGAIIVGVIGIFLITVGWLPGTVAYGIAATAIAVVAKMTRGKSK